MGIIWTIIIGFAAGVSARLVRPDTNEPDTNEPAGFVLSPPPDRWHPLPLCTA